VGPPSLAARFLRGLHAYLVRRAALLGRRWGPLGPGFPECRAARNCLVARVRLAVRVAPLRLEAPLRGACAFPSSSSSSSWTWSRRLPFGPQAWIRRRSSRVQEPAGTPGRAFQSACAEALPGCAV